MAHWFHRNPLKSTAAVNFELKGCDALALKICSELRQARSRLLELVADPNQPSDSVVAAYELYLSLLKGFVTAVDESSSEGQSKLRHSLRFKWTHSMLGNIPQAQSDVMFEIVCLSLNVAFWFSKHAAQIAAKDDISMEEAKEVHKCLRKCAGIIKTMQDKYVGQLLEKNPAGSDSDGHVMKAYISMATAEAQEVTVARAIEMKHKPALVSALAHETSKIFQAAGDAIASMDNVKFGKWKKYLQLKSEFYMAYAYCFCGENLLSQDKCGEAIRALQEGEKYYAQVSRLCKEYATIKAPKGVGAAKPEQHLFFRKLGSSLRRTLEKCQRENGFIYHQKVPAEVPQLEVKATYGLVSPEEHPLPAAHSLWTPQAYSGFNIAANLSQDPANSKAAVKAEGELPPVKEANVQHSTSDPKNHSGCLIS